MLRVETFLFRFFLAESFRYALRRSVYGIERCGIRVYTKFPQCCEGVSSVLFLFVELLIVCHV